METELKRILLRRDTESNLNSSTNLSAGEPVYATDTNKLGVGVGGNEVVFAALESDLLSEASARTNADNTLQDNIDAEETAS